MGFKRWSTGGVCGRNGLIFWYFVSSHVIMDICGYLKKRVKADVRRLLWFPC